MVFWLVLLCFSLLLLLFKKLASLPLVGGTGRQDGRAELEGLLRTLPRLHAAIQDADQRETKDEGLVLWLQEIKDVACDAEDVIDELEYEELRRQVEGGSRSQTSGFRCSLPPSYREALMQKIKEIRRRLEAIARERNDLGIGNLGTCVHHVGTRERTKQISSLVWEAEVFGRGKEKEEIIQFLLGSDYEVRPSIIAVTGIGGLGKTTLAQLVYNDKRVEEHFDLKMWVHVTTDYDVLKLTKEILVSTHDHHMHSSWNIESLDVCQRHLLKKLEGKRFLLVIDNLWDRDHRMWLSLRAPLIYGEKGSKVLITTQDRNIARTLQATKTVELEGLPFQDSWMLFKKHAFVDGNSGEYPGLEAIGKQIVDKVNGVPLAAIAMGNLLYSQLEESEWIRILECKIWEVEKVEDGILSLLKLSYDRLPAQLRQCFAYCSLFPKNYKFDKLELVQQWMAQGFVPGGGRRRMEDVGNEYLDDLLNRSLFQYVDGKLIIHDLIHDLAHLISQRDHLMIEIDGSHEILESAHRSRHLSLVMTCRQPNQRSLEVLCTYRGLRTLAFYFRGESRFQIPYNLFLNLRTLRVLDLSCGGIEMLPDSIGNLKHLRYLDLRRNSFRSLPESLCSLYKLQTLKLEGCYYIQKLPVGITNLINLRHLDVEPYLLSEVAGIGKLTCLQALKSFQVSEGHGIKIDDLKDMHELRGGLCLLDLHRVRSKEEAVRAMLNSKRFLDELEMHWDSGADDKNISPEEVLEGLVPPVHLKSLIIDGYDGVRCPSWMEQRSISKLESLRLRICENLSSLPVLWCSPFLTRMEIFNCPQLKDLPAIPTTLRELTISNVGLEVLPEFYLSYKPLSGMIREIVSPSLSVLNINSCPSLTSLQQGLLQHHLKNLSKLIIQRCENLVYWPDGAGFQATLLSLEKELCINYCPNIMAFPARSILSVSLKRLTVTGSPCVLNGALFAQLHGFSPESIVHVEKSYENLEGCSEEVLQYMTAADWLEIRAVEDDSYAVFYKPIYLVCDKERVWSWKCDDWVLAWRVKIWIRRLRRRRRKGGSLHSVLQSAAPFYFVPPGEWWQRRSSPPIRPGEVIHGDDDQSHCDDNLISKCLGEIPWASSLRWLVVNGALHPAFLSFNLALLEGLWVSHCKGGSLLTDLQLSHLTGLKELQIFDCPELMLLSLQKAIRSLPSLQHLTIRACPKLSSASFSFSHPSVTTLPSHAAALKTLFVDDANLLSAVGFVKDQLSCLQSLHIWHSPLTSLTVLAIEGLQILKQSLQHLSFNDCPELQHLPSDLQSLLPFLKALAMGQCPKLRRLPKRGLPTLLEILVIHQCPLLQQRFRSHSALGQEGQQDWPKITHIPVVVIGGDIVRGSYREFLELRAKWRDF